MINPAQAFAVYRKKEEENQQLVALPNPIKNSSLIEGTFTWTERLLFTLVSAEVINSRVLDLKDEIPTPLTKMLNCIDSLFASLNVEDKEEGSSLVVSEVSDGVQQLIAQKKALFAQAGVRSWSEFDDKAATLARYKAEALSLHIALADNIALRKRIDEEVVRTATGELSTRNQRILNNYWELISRDPKDYHPHMATIVATMKTAFEAMTQLVEKMQESSFRANMG